MKRFFNQTLLLSSFILGLSACALPALAKALAPVSALTLSAQDQQALRAALSPEMENTITWVWQGEPLTLTLPLQQEKRLIFPEPVQVDVNGQLTTEQLRVINDHQAIYLTALTAFEKTRIYITLKNSGRIIFLDVSTKDKKQKSEANTIKITVSPNLISHSTILKKKAAANTFDLSDSLRSQTLFSETTDTLSDAPFFSASVDDWVQAIRFAWQQLYAPSYLLPNDTDFMRSPMHTEFWISGLLYSDAVFAHPLASWTRAELFVTAIELRNPYPHPTSLDLTRDLCGHWRAAMLYPRTILQPAGNKPNDSTTLFLISNTSFDRVFSGGGCDHGRA